MSKMVPSNTLRYNYVDYAELDLDTGLYLFTDGSTHNNGQKDPTKPCIGGWGYVIVDDGNVADEGSGGSRSTTISRMELAAAIEGLKRITDNTNAGTEVTVVSDSQYVVRGACEYLRGWLKRGWKNSNGEPTANMDLWKKLVKLSNASNVLSVCHLKVRWSWVRGHMNHVHNERCDVLAATQKDVILKEMGLA